MKSLKVTLGLLAVALCATVSSVSAQATLSGGADFVSTYVWRGAYQTGASVQPYAEIGFGNFAVGAWGSTSLETSAQTKEFDYYVSYSTGNFSAVITDYWWSGESFESDVLDELTGELLTTESIPYLISDKDSHYYELSLSYSFGDSFPLSVAVSTMLGGGADLNSKGEQAYSTYIEFGYPVAIGDASLDLAVGMTPAKGMYSDKFSVCNLSATASKAVAISDSFELPLFASCIVNPDQKRAYLLAGFSLSF